MLWEKRNSIFRTRAYLGRVESEILDLARMSESHGIDSREAINAETLFSRLEDASA
jgi:hypothetical protein